MRWTLRRRMIALIALPTLVIYVLVLGVTMRHLEGQNREQVEGEMTRLAQNYAARFDGYLRQAATIADTTANFLDTYPGITERELYAQLRRNVLQLDYIYAGAIAFEPGTFKADGSLFSPYVYRGGEDGALLEMNINKDAYDWYNDTSWEWFHRPKREGRGIWTDPYFDEGAGQVLMVTYSTPFHRDGEFRGVVTIDIEVPLLNDTVGRHIVGDHNLYVLTQDGQFVYSSNKANIGRNVFETSKEQGRPDIAELARHVTSGEVGVSSLAGVHGIDPTGSVYWVFYAPIESTGWGFASDVLESEAMAAVRHRMAVGGGAMGATLVLIIGAIFLVSGHIARPIVRLRKKVVEISEGDLDTRVEGITSKDEIGDLAASFNKMTADLRTHVDNLANEQAAREKIERDLDIAREIQRGLLPTGELDIPGFEISGWSQAADKTGGDYFDWIELPDGKVGVVLADVTGHGIGPALIAAVCRAYIRAATQSEGASVSDVLARVNTLLTADIPDTHFVTAVAVLMDPAASAMTLVSAGHGPILFYEAASDTLHSWDADFPPLAVIDGVDFPEPRHIDWHTGDVLVLLTDGFFEWADPDHEQYGTQRLRDYVSQNHAMAPADLIAGLHESVLAHARGTAQADDLTAVVIKKI